MAGSRYVGESRPALVAWPGARTRRIRPLGPVTMVRDQAGSARSVSMTDWRPPGTIAPADSRAPAQLTTSTRAGTASWSTWVELIHRPGVGWPVPLWVSSTQSNRTWAVLSPAFQGPGCTSPVVPWPVRTSWKRSFSPTE